MRQYKVYIIAGAIALVLLVIFDLILAAKKKPSIIGSITDIASPVTPTEQQALPTDEPTPTPPQFAGLPTRYKNRPIPQSLYKEAYAKFDGQNPAEIKQYVLDRVRRYYIFQDYLFTTNIPYTAPTPLTFKALEEAVPQMQSLIEDNLISSVDFAYIKARFRNMPTEDMAKDKWGNVEAKAKEILETYRQKFTTTQDAQTVVTESNQDFDLKLLNFNEENELLTNYTVKGNLFFTDKGFHQFLFKQRVNQPSEIYTVLGADKQPYAFVIVYVTRRQATKYESIDELIREELSNFS